MYNYLDRYIIQQIFESTGFRTKFVNNNLIVETDAHNIEIVCMGEYAYFEDKFFIIPQNIDDPKQFVIDYDVKLLQSANLIVNNDATSITILRPDCEIYVIYDEYGFIHDFQYCKLHDITLGGIGSMIGRGCENIEYEPICAYIEPNRDGGNDEDDDSLWEEIDL